MTFRQYTTEELIEALKQHPGKKVLIEDQQICLVALDRLKVSEVNHITLGQCVALHALGPNSRNISYSDTSSSRLDLARLSQTSLLHNVRVSDSHVFC